MVVSASSDWFAYAFARMPLSVITGPGRPRHEAPSVEEVLEVEVLVARGAVDEELVLDEDVLLDDVVVLGSVLVLREVDVVLGGTVLDGEVLVLVVEVRDEEEELVLVLEVGRTVVLLVDDVLVLVVEVGRTVVLLVVTVLDDVELLDVVLVTGAPVVTTTAGNPPPDSRASYSATSKLGLSPTTAKQ